MLNTPSLKVLTEHEIMGKAEREETEWQLIKYRALSRHQGLNGRREYYVRKFREVKNKIIMSNLRYILKMASYYKVPEDRWDDVIIEAVMGFDRAMEKYDGSFKLTTYAGWWIRQFISRGVLWDHTVRYPAYQYERSRVPFHNISSVDDLYPDGKAVVVLEDEEPQADERINELENGEMIRELVEELPEREKDIINRRFGFHDGEPHTLNRVAKHYGLTRERIRQIQGVAMRRLKALMSFRGIEAYG